MRGERGADRFGILLSFKMGKRELAVWENEKHPVLQIDSQRLRLWIAFPGNEARIV